MARMPRLIPQCNCVLLLRLKNTRLEQPTTILEIGDGISFPCTTPSTLTSCCSVLKSCETLRPQRLQHTRLLCPLLTPGVYPNSRSLNQWCYLTISSSATPFSFSLPSFPASESFSMSQPFISGGQSIGASASATVLPVNIWGWFSLRLTGLILQFEGLSRVFSSTTSQKHQFFSTQLSLWSNSHIHTWLSEKP